MADQYDEGVEGDQSDESSEKRPFLSEGSVYSISYSYQSSEDHSSKQSNKVIVVLCILLTELCERLTFYGLTANLLLFCRQFLELESPWPSTIQLLFQGTCYLVPIIGGWLADSYMGRFNVIYGCGLLYFVGTVLLAVVSIRPHLFALVFGSGADLGETSRLIYFGLALAMIAFGTGGIKSNVSPFGADQVQEDGPAALERFFNLFVWFINVGSLVAFTLIVYIQHKYDFVSGYIITASTMLLGLLLFVTGRNKYWHKEPRGSQLTDAVNIIRQAIKNHKKTVGEKATSWLDYAKQRFGGTYSEMQVEDVKALLRLIPVFLVIITYWMIFSQGLITYLLQATYLRLRVNDFEVPAASLGIFQYTSSLILIPLFDRVVYPVMRACGIRCTPLQRIGVGMLFAVLSVCTAGWLEIERKHYISEGHFINQTVFNKTHNASSMSIFYQVPQFLFLGASEVLVVVPGSEMAYSQSPKGLQGLMLGVFLVTYALGNYSTNLLLLIIRAIDVMWYPSDDPNQGKLEIFFFILACIMVVNFLGYLLVASSFQYKTEVDENTERKCRKKRNRPNEYSSLIYRDGDQEE